MTRYPQALSPGDVFVGHFEEYDVWYCQQAYLPPTIVARYGEAPSMYLSLNPNLVVEGTIEHAAPVFRFAIEQVKQLGLNFAWAA